MTVNYMNFRRYSWVWVSEVVCEWHVYIDNIILVWQKSSDNTVPHTVCKWVLVSVNLEFLSALLFFSVSDWLAVSNSERLLCSTLHLVAHDLQWEPLWPTLKRLALWDFWGSINRKFLEIQEVYLNSLPWFCIFLNQYVTNTSDSQILSISHVRCHWCSLYKTQEREW